VKTAKTNPDIATATAYPTEAWWPATTRNVHDNGFTSSVPASKTRLERKKLGSVKAARKSGLEPALKRVGAVREEDGEIKMKLDTPGLIAFGKRIYHVTTWLDGILFCGSMKLDDWEN
jgi:hypothetical protein